MLSLRFNRNDPHDSVFLKKKKNHKKIINVTHYDSIIAVVVILFVALHLFSLYIKKPNSSYYTEHSKLFLIGTCCSYWNGSAGAWRRAGLHSGVEKFGFSLFRFSLKAEWRIERQRRGARIEIMIFILRVRLWGRCSRCVTWRRVGDTIGWWFNDGALSSDSLVLVYSCLTDIVQGSQPKELLL